MCDNASTATLLMVLNWLQDKRKISLPQSFPVSRAQNCLSNITTHKERVEGSSSSYQAS
jgi:hypothetical protein